MGAATTLAATVAAAVGAVALYRFVDRKKREIEKLFTDPSKPSNGKVIDFERDPESGVYRPKG